MSEFQIICPHCSQAISCDEQWAGLEIQCPLCQGALVAPQLQGKPKSKLSVAAAPSSHSPAPPPTTPKRSSPPKRGVSKEKLAMIAKIAVTIIALAVGIYFGWPYVQKLQSKFSSSVDKANEESDGGQLGHIASIHATLDATDPARRERDDGPMELPANVPNAAAAQAASPPKKDLPVIAPTWDLEAEPAAIPKSRLNGMVAGENFLADSIRFDRISSGYILDLRQGTNAIPDRQMQVVLRLKQGQKIETNSWMVTKDLRTGIPQVVKKWKTGPRTVGQKVFSTGYAMKLEFGEISNGVLSGKIYLALPDPEQTVIAGEFDASTRLLGAKENAATGY